VAVHPRLGARHAAARHEANGPTGTAAGTSIIVKAGSRQKRVERPYAADADDDEEESRPAEHAARDVGGNGRVEHTSGRRRGRQHWQQEDECSRCEVQLVAPDRDARPDAVHAPAGGDDAHPHRRQQHAAGEDDHLG